MRRGAAITLALALGCAKANDGCSGATTILSVGDGGDDAPATDEGDDDDETEDGTAGELGTVGAASGGPDDDDDDDDDDDAASGGGDSGGGPGVATYPACLAEDQCEDAMARCLSFEDSWGVTKYSSKTQLSCMMLRLPHLGSRAIWKGACCRRPTPHRSHQPSVS